MTYVDGFVLPVPKARYDEYKVLAGVAATVWMQHGALSYMEAEPDDVQVGELTSFPRAVQLKDDEIVIFSFVTYPSRAARDATMQKVMADPRLKDAMAGMPFDGKRMIFGGFQSIVER